MVAQRDSTAPLESTAQCHLWLIHQIDNVIPSQFQGGRSLLAATIRENSLYSGTFIQEKPLSRGQMSPEYINIGVNDIKTNEAFFQK